MTAAMEIRALRPADLGDYKVLRDAMLAAHEYAFTSDAASETLRSAESYQFRLAQPSANGTLFTLCAWIDGHMVGAVTCERDKRAKVAHIGHIVGMMVRDDFQGQGLGRELLNAALKLARADARLEQLVLPVTAGNERAARLYLAAGFVRYGTQARAIKLAANDAASAVYLDKDLMVLTLR